MSVRIKWLLVIVFLAILEDSFIAKTNCSAINGHPKEGKVYIPARARKAGGTLRRTIVSNPNIIDRVEVYPNSNINPNDMTQVEKGRGYIPANAQKAGGGGGSSFRRNEDDFIEKVEITGKDRILPQERKPEEYVPVNAQKAGGTFRKIKEDAKKQEKSEAEVSKIEGNSEYDDYEETEKKCPRGQFFHIRGQQCVPFKCDPKYFERDPMFGGCYPKYETSFSNYYGRSSNYSPYVYRTDWTRANRQRTFGRWGGYGGR